MVAIGTTDPLMERTPMRRKSIILAGVGLGAAALIGTAGYASAQDTSPPAGTGARRQFVCAHVAEFQKLQADHLTLVGDRLALLNEAKAAAEQNGNTKAAGRIGDRIDRVTKRQGEITQRQQKLAETCAASG
jgi:hypothetical protein